VRYVWTMTLKPGCAAEYQRQHDEIWPDMLATLEAAGMRNYSISRGGDLLVGVFETDDLAAMIKTLSASEAAGRWQRAMSQLVNNERDSETGYLRLLEPVFWFGGSAAEGASRKQDA